MRNGQPGSAERRGERLVANSLLQKLCWATRKERTMDADTKMPPDDFFREIGFDTEMWFDGCREEIFFLRPAFSDDEPGSNRMEKVSPEAVAEFIAYWENQIAVARDYVANGCNPRTHEWRPGR